MTIAAIAASSLYPDRVNPGGALWLSARGVKP
jgi:hypothetical protein